MLRSISRLFALFALVVSVLAVFVSPASGQEETRIHLLHGIPDVSVDVTSDGEPVIEGFEFSQTAMLDELAGQTLPDFMVKVAGTDDVVLDLGDVALPESGNHTIVAHLNEDGEPTLTVFENDLTEVPAGDGRIVVRHTASAPAVDVRSGGEPVVSDLSNTEEATIHVQPGTVRVELAPAGSARPRYLQPTDLDIDEGTLTIVYAVGSIEDGNDLAALVEVFEGLQSSPSVVNTGDSFVSRSALFGAVVLALGCGLSVFGVRRRLSNA